ncbi:MAG: hypothetical protein NZ524_00910 [Thiobacillaceae bacterium]|nr:hypothetical protein [Thiobacillaceae bacterium]MCX7672855.1 hypothetical protein [Thiobacillaceae bacterium]MDW8324698.1 hypothetical protein [Burkholderiales bacterium]
MSRPVHRFARPAPLPPTAAEGEPWQAGVGRYDEGAQYRYRHGAHELTLFWSAPTPAEVRALRERPLTLALHTLGPAAFLLYRIEGVCDWSDLAFNWHRWPSAERELPAEPTGERARLRLTLVDAADGIVRAKRLLSLDRVMTQALRHVLAAQSVGAFDMQAYADAVEALHARYPEPAALAAVAEFHEAALG